MSENTVVKEQTDANKLAGFRKKATELEKWLHDNIDSPRFDEVARDWRALTVKIDSYEQRIATHHNPGAYVEQVATYHTSKTTFKSFN